MIHTLITAISTNLPMRHILLGAITSLLIAASLFLWLKRGSRSGDIMLLALAIVVEGEIEEGQMNIGLDLGYSTVKAVSANKRVNFPSVAGRDPKPLCQQT